MLACDSGELRRAFCSILGHHWYARLRGWEIDDRHFARHSFGQSYVLPRRLIADRDILPILAKLVEKMGTRLRRNRFRARGVYLAIQYRGFDLWHRARRLPGPIDDPADLHRELAALYAAAPSSFFCRASRRRPTGARAGSRRSTGPTSSTAPGRSSPPGCSVPRTRCRTASRSARSRRSRRSSPRAAL